MNFTEKLDKLLEQHKISISELSRNSDIPYTTIDGFYKKGYANMKLSTLKKLSEYFDISIDYLVNDDYDEVLQEQSPEEKEFLNKFKTLDIRGRKAVEAVLQSHYDRLHPQTRAEDDFIILPFFADKAAAGSGYALSDGAYDEWKVASTRLTNRADFIVTVSGASMEPDFYDGEMVLVQQQPDIYDGEVGIFIVNGNGYIKQKGKDRLVSLNRKYKDIFIGEDDNVMCAGKVIGKLSEDELLN